MEDEHQVEQEHEEQRHSRCSSSQEEQHPVTDLEQQLVEANTTIAVLTEQLKAAKENQQKLETELAETRASTPQLMMELAVEQERLKVAEENQARLEKQLADSQARIMNELPRLETELAVAKEQLKAFGDKFKAVKQEHTLQLENITLQLKSMEENHELQQRAENLLTKSKDREPEELPAPEKLYLAPMMIMPDMSNELTCVTFVTGSSREAIDEKVQRLRGQLVPGAKAILVESEEEADNIKQSIVDRGRELTKRKRNKNPKLEVDVEFYNEPNKLCTRHADDETTTREEFLRLFKLPFAPLGELVEHIAPEIEAPEKTVDKEIPPVVTTTPLKKIVEKATPPASPTSGEEMAEEPRPSRIPSVPIEHARRDGSAVQDNACQVCSAWSILGEQIFAGNLCTGSMSLDDAKPTSGLRSLRDLKPMVGKELELGTTHRGRYLCGWVAIDDAFFGIASSSLLLEDVTGYLVEIAAYGLVDTELPPHERQRVVAGKFPKGRPIVVLEPYYKVRMDGSEGVRVDEADEIIPWRDVPTDLMSWKNLGNEFFSTLNSQNEGRGALACYQRALEAVKSETHTLAILLTNLATCRFKVEDYAVSIQLSGAAVHLDPTYFKGWYRLASALATVDLSERKEYSDFLPQLVVAQARKALPSLPLKEQMLQNTLKNDSTPNFKQAHFCSVCGRMRLAHATAKAQSNPRLRLLPREIQMFLTNPPPEIHTEFPKLRGWPEGIDTTLAEKLLYRAFLDASVNPWIGAQRMCDGSFFENISFSEKVKRWHGMAVMEFLRARGAINHGEIIDGREGLDHVPSYHAKTRCNFSNNVSRADIYYFDSTHVAIGFNDFSSLLAATLCKNSSRDGPLRYVGFEMSEFAVAKCKVVGRMLGSPSVSISSVMEVWLSSTWSETTLKDFRESLNSILASPQERTENPKVLSYLKHWASAETISAAESRSQFLSNLEKHSSRILPALCCFRRQIDRLDLTQYMLSGEIRASSDVMNLVEKEQPGATKTKNGAAGMSSSKKKRNRKKKKAGKGQSAKSTSPAPLVGNLTMWNVPTDSAPLDDDIALNTVDFMSLVEDYVEREKRQKNSTNCLSVVDLFVIHILKNLHRLRGLMLTNKLTIEVNYGVVKAVRGDDPANQALLTRIAEMRPQTMSWSNLLDYFSLEDFHDLARRCSMHGDCMHYGYSTNWPAQVFGASMIDYHPRNARMMIDAVLNSVLGFSSEALAVPSIVDMLTKENLDKLLFLPFREPPLDATAYVLAQMLSVVDLFIIHLFHRLRSLMLSNKLSLQRNYGVIKVVQGEAANDPMSQALLKRIAEMRPQTMSWSNLLDYFSLEDFHDLARRCSMYRDCRHY
ncbi:Tetratricopeptide-like helical domain [Phytophthora cactorum]|nr:Tetratricopeptide-like helical domain [Phytophthora cactorum]